MKLQVMPTEKKPGELTLSWEVLEHGDGALIQVVYAGGADVRLLTSGVIIGQREVPNLIGTIAEGGTPSDVWFIVFGGSLLVATAAIMFWRRQPFFEHSSSAVFSGFVLLCNFTALGSLIRRPNGGSVNQR